MKAARGHFEQALELAPDSARAHAGIADLYFVAGGCSLNLFRGIDVLPKMKFHAEKAIALDPGLGQAYGTLGLLRTWFEWDWAGAEQAMDRGVEIEPSSAGGYICRSYYLTIVGRHEEAIGDIRRGIELDPVSPILFSIAGWHHYFAGRGRGARILRARGRARS
jgi:tetratricopeptide (TPR) repeat protein